MKPQHPPHCIIGWCSGSRQGSGRSRSGKGGYDSVNILFIYFSQERYPGYKPTWQKYFSYITFWIYLSMGKNLLDIGDLYFSKCKWMGHGITSQKTRVFTVGASNLRWEGDRSNSTPTAFGTTVHCHVIIIMVYSNSVSLTVFTEMNEKLQALAHWCFWGVI
jgi:hypothetical protein